MEFAARPADRTDAVAAIARSARFQPIPARAVADRPTNDTDERFRAARRQETPLMPTPERARVLVVMSVAALLGVAFPASSPPPRPAGPAATATLTDVQTFTAVIERVRAGEPYYTAMGSELRRHDYPTFSTFNWRTPLHLALLARAPWAFWRVVLTVLLVALYVATMMTARDRTAGAIANVLMIGVVVVFSASDAVYVSEAWAGVLIGLSACAFAVQRWPAGVALALAALFVRELAAPYCAAATLVAAYRRRWREVAAWAAGAAGYAVYFAWHATQVAAHQIPSDMAGTGSWLTFGGVPFLLATLTKLSWFALLPVAAAPIALALLSAGLVAPGLLPQVRVPAAAYAALFLIAGHPFNDYWGFITAPIWALVTAHGATAVVRAIRAAR
jgi:hypothetical protein